MTQRNSPERADIVERLRDLTRDSMGDRFEAADEIQRLRVEVSLLRNAAASTDPAWAEQLIADAERRTP